MTRHRPFSGKSFCDIKAIVTGTPGYGIRFHIRWPRPGELRLEERVGSCLDAFHPFCPIGAGIARKLREVVALAHLSRMLEVFRVGAEAGFVEPPVARLLLERPGELVGARIAQH